ncbi:hypothetical protein pdam_00009450, partial [Pocillopora damicornis]
MENGKKRREEWDNKPQSHKFADAPNVGNFGNKAKPRKQELPSILFTRCAWVLEHSLLTSTETMCFRGILLEVSLIKAMGLLVNSIPNSPNLQLKNCLAESRRVTNKILAVKGTSHQIKFLIALEAKLIAAPHLPELSVPQVDGVRLITVWFGGGGGQQTPRGSAVIVGCKDSKQFEHPFKNLNKT